MLINLRNALMGGKRLPYDAEVEYLQGDGSAYIETGKSLYDGDIECRFAFTQSTSDRAALGYLAYGNWKGASALGLTAGCGAFVYNGELRVRYGASQNVTVAPYDAAQHTLKTVNKVIYFDDVITSVSAKCETYNGDIVDTIPLFCERRNGTSPSARSTCRIYSFKVYRNDTIIQDLIPVRKGTVGYLYDRVSGKLFGNAGAGDFVLGQDKN